ncbi:SMI1/KNR4 family protein [Rubripirellula amarantea]|nr:SMI1/KNR4 family protein [Rubripirellula amarantea]
MSSSSDSPPPSSDWSRRLAHRYQVELSATLADWFDRRMWEQVGAGEFHAPISPQELLEPFPDAIWPALMRCDLIPIIGNNAGDYICAVVDADNRDAEYIHWFHGGGDWIPWGKSLPEALVFDAVNHRLPGPKRDNAIPAEDPRPNHQSTLATDPLLAWARSHLPANLRLELDDSSLYETIFESDISFEAARLRKIEAIFENPSAESHLADAMRLVNEVIRRRNDLAWAHHVAGDISQRQGDADAASHHFLASCFCSVFSDQSVRLRHNWDNRVAVKFGASQLASLSADDAYYLQLLVGPDSSKRKQLITEYWINESERASAAGQNDIAYDYVINAGWDVGAPDLRSYGRIIKLASEYAEKAGQSARHHIAETHLACFQSRYGRL